MSSYIDEIAKQIYVKAELDVDPEWFEESYKSLYRLYAVLALSTGEDTTHENVHDAWAAWMSGVMPDHPSLVPFGLSDPGSDSRDDSYVKAIRDTAAELKTENHHANA